MSIKFKGTLACNSLALNRAYHKQKSGLFINDGNISITDTETLNIKNKGEREQKLKKYGLHILDNITFQNNNKLSFNRKFILSLKEGVLVNNTAINFLKEARIIGMNNVYKLGNPLVYSKEENPRLINNGHMKGSEELGLFTKCFVSEGGRIHASQILMAWDGRCQNQNFAYDIEQKIPYISEDKEFPIIDITRIPNSLKQEYALDVAALGEQAACSFYEKFLKQKAFSHKANSQENGIDVIAYDETPAEIIIHESKNYRDNSFDLGDNQMTETWVYGHLFRLYQDFLKESARILQTKIPSLPSSQYGHLKAVLLITLKEDYLKNLEKLNKWIDDDNIPVGKNNLVNKMQLIMEKNMSQMTLEEYKDYFQDLDIYPRGNSIVHCKLPIINDHGFGDSSTEPTYFIRRDLAKRFAEEGEVPKPKG